MSDYRRERAIRLRIDDDIVKQLGFEKADDLIYDFDELVAVKLPELASYSQLPRFETSYGETEKYIDLFLYSEADGCGEFESASYLSEREKEFFGDIFAKLGIELADKSRLRKVDYCWYDGVDAPDCYEVYDTDEWVDEYLALLRRRK